MRGTRHPAPSRRVPAPTPSHLVVLTFCGIGWLVLVCFAIALLTL